MTDSDVIPSVRPIARRERGSMLALVLLLLVPLAVMAGAILQLGSRQSSEGDAARGRARALLNAESGLDRAVARLIEDPDDLEPFQEYDESGGSLLYRVEFEELGDDDVDNDGDGAIDESDEGSIVRIASRGALNVASFDVDGNAVSNGGTVYTRRVRALGKKGVGLPLFPYAVYLDDPIAELRLNGNALIVDGNDHDDANTLNGKAAVMGIATTGDVAAIKSQISKSQKDNIKGAGGSPSVLGTGNLDLQKIIDDYKASADIVMKNPSSPYSGKLGDASAGDFVVTHVVGNLKLTGQGSGAGLLLVEGNLDIVGGWNFSGVVIVTGQVIFRGGGGTKKVVGSLLVGGDVVDAPTTEDIEMSGTVDVLYSSTIQKKVSEAVSSLTLYGWEES